MEQQTNDDGPKTVESYRCGSSWEPITGTHAAADDYVSNGMRSIIVVDMKTEEVLADVGSVRPLKDLTREVFRILNLVCDSREIFLHVDNASYWYSDQVEFYAKQHGISLIYQKPYGPTGIAKYTEPFIKELIN